MPLRRKIVLLFLVLALAPVVVVGLGDYLRAARMTREAAAARLGAAAELVARSVAVGRVELELELAGLGAEVAGGRELGEAAAGSGFERVEWRDGSGRVLAEWRGAASVGCSGAVVEVSRRLESGGVLRGEVSARGLLGAADRMGEGTGVRAVLLERESGRVLADGGCGREEPWPGATGEAGQPVVPAGMVIGHADLEEPAWRVVAAASDAALAAANVERGIRLAAMLFVVLAAAGGFAILVRHLMGSLAQLTEAAERIGEGDFTPWLPPPGDDEVGRLSDAIAAMVARIEEMMRQLERNRQLAVVGSMASQLSHEIRNPLSSIQLNLQSLGRDVRRGEVPADIDGVIDICLSEIQRLDAVLTNVLRLGRPAATALSPCDVQGLIGECVAVLGPQLARQGIRVERRLSASRSIDTDAGQLKAVLLNLMLNGVQAMAQGGTLRIGTELAQRKDVGEVLRIRVRDDGPGIPPRDRARIFQPFFTTKVNGTGLGLALAVQTVESLGGWIYLDRSSELDRGAEFVIELPVAARAGNEAESAPRREPALALVAGGVA